MMRKKEKVITMTVTLILAVILICIKVTHFVIIERPLKQCRIVSAYHLTVDTNGAQIDQSWLFEKDDLTYLDALLNPPTNDMILEHLKKEMGHIPADYIEFLKQCNGLTLYHSGDYCLFDAQEILSFHFSNDNLLCRSAWKIGYWMGYDIVINVDDIEKEYLYAGDCCSTDEFICVGNILNFIEEIVKNGGDPYWTINENQYRDFSKK